jgi:Flp pilus assembly protein TadG
MTESILPLNTLGRFKRLCQRLRVDTSGVAAIEFAFIAPLMFTMLVGTVEMSQAITVDRRVTLVASTTADLVAREKALKADDIDTIFKIVNVLFSPYEVAPLRIKILLVGAKVDDSSKTKVCWSYDYDGSANPPSLSTTYYAVNADYTLPAKVNVAVGTTATTTVGLVENGGSVVVAEVEYQYQPLIFSYFIAKAFPLKETFYLKPRVSSSIDFTAANGTVYKRDGGASCNWPT